MVSLNQKEFVSLDREAEYSWEFIYSRNPVFGVDYIVSFNLTPEQVFKLAFFLSEHLKTEVVKVVLHTEKGDEDEAVISRGSLVYLNGLSSLLTAEEVPQY